MRIATGEDLQDRPCVYARGGLLTPMVSTEEVEANADRLPLTTRVFLPPDFGVLYAEPTLVEPEEAMRW